MRKKSSPTKYQWVTGRWSVFIGIWGYSASAASIENLGGILQLTGVVKANDTIVGRIPLFDVELTRAPEVMGDPVAGVGILRIRGASLTLTEGAADALNTAFGLDGVFTAGFPIGTARIYARIRDRDG